MSNFKVDVQCDCTAGCARCGQSHSAIDLTEARLIPTSGPTPTSTRVNMEMVVGSVERDPETGATRANYFAKFSTENGHTVLYPWEALKEMVLRWMEVERKGHDRS